MIRFDVHMATDALHDRRVLAFLRPLVPVSNLRVHAWQVLNASAGATETFYLDPVVGLAVETRGDGASIRSEPVAVRPGELYLALTPNGLSPTLQRAPGDQASARLTCTQGGLRNLTNPYRPVDCCWYVGGYPVVTVPAVDWGMTCSFELQPCVYFLMAGLYPGNHALGVQAYTGMTPVPLTLNTSRIAVEVRRELGAWVFSWQRFN